jgi:hypothetical protein
MFALFHMMVDIAEEQLRGLQNPPVLCMGREKVGGGA